MVKDMFLVSIFDTTVSDNNLGNQIIMESVYEYLRIMFPEQFFVKLPYLDSIGPESLNYIAQSKYVFFGGTNALSAEMENYKQWGIDESNVSRIKNVILMGVGWWQYQGAISLNTRGILRSVLHENIYHSVRDSYTVEKLYSIGLKKVINTGCPSLWNITDDICGRIPRGKAENVLVTFTNYSQYPERDSYLADIVRRNYRDIYVWIQGPEDFAYAQKLIGDFHAVPPSVGALDSLLQSNTSLDYVGTRLHAGIRALQFARRSIIIGIDNRAIEMGRDFNLTIIKKDDISKELERLINSDFRTSVRVPSKNIEKWKSQFEQ